MGRWKPNPSGIAALRQPGSEPYRAIERIVEDLADTARALAPFSDPPQYGRPPGALKASIHIEDQTPDTNGPVFRVIADAVNPRDDFHYALTVHQGRGAITSIRPMRFRNKQGRLVSKFSVGPAAPDPYLTDALAALNAVLAASNGPSLRFNRSNG